ncbi:MAG TPA: alpha/beta fold hydrolase [Candidatus Binatia bacterium]|nr:alpha/beta fold hydrolase [Candidatus Binatia bacterium]
MGVVHGAEALTPPGVILCHGMESTKEGTKHRRLAERLSHAGLSVLRFDFSYVGESEGEFADLTFRGEVDDLGGAWDFFRTRVGGPIGILGSSMGGAVALLFAADEPRVRALATIAAIAYPARAIAELRPAELERWRREGVLSLGGVRLKRSFLDDVETLDVIGACRRVACPTFVAHGDADRVVPCSDAEEIVAALGGGHRLKIYPGADHRFSRPSDLEALLDDCAAWLEGHLLRNGAA